MEKIQELLSANEKVLTAHFREIVSSKKTGGVTTNYFGDFFEQELTIEEIRGIRRDPKFAGVHTGRNCILINVSGSMSDVGLTYPDVFDRLWTDAIDEFMETRKNERLESFSEPEGETMGDDEKTPQNAAGQPRGQCVHCRFQAEYGRTGARRCLVAYHFTPINPWGVADPAASSNQRRIEGRARFERSLLRLAEFSECTEYVPGRRLNDETLFGVKFADRPEIRQMSDDRVDVYR